MAEPDSAVSEELKEAFLTMRQVHNLQNKKRPNYAFTRPAFGGGSAPRIRPICGRVKQKREEDGEN
ncbi:MAG: hypothetical protein DRN08_07610 [Thermoplasmata archaeon]|nr:MAG: hypothetical protein DRN08_07610 [Thermoplasmata archaeon]